MKRITIHAITLSVNFDSVNHQEAAEMAASLVRECEWAALRINKERNPQPAPQPPEPITDFDLLDDGSVRHDDPF